MGWMLDQPILCPGRHATQVSTLHDCCHSPIATTSTEMDIILPCTIISCTSIPDKENEGMQTWRPLVHFDLKKRHLNLPHTISTKSPSSLMSKKGYDGRWWVQYIINYCKDGTTIHLSLGWQPPRSPDTIQALRSPINLQGGSVITIHCVSSYRSNKLLQVSLVTNTVNASKSSTMRVSCMHYASMGCLSPHRDSQLKHLRHHRHRNRRPSHNLKLIRTASSTLENQIILYQAIGGSCIPQAHFQKESTIPSSNFSIILYSALFSTHFSALMAYIRGLNISWSPWIATSNKSRITHGRIIRFLTPMRPIQGGLAVVQYIKHGLLSVLHLIENCEKLLFDSQR